MHLAYVQYLKNLVIHRGGQKWHNQFTYVKNWANNKRKNVYYKLIPRVYIKISVQCALPRLQYTFGIDAEQPYMFICKFSMKVNTTVSLFASVLTDYGQSLCGASTTLPMRSNFLICWYTDSQGGIIAPENTPARDVYSNH